MLQFTGNPNNNLVQEIVHSANDIIWLTNLNVKLYLTNLNVKL